MTKTTKRWLLGVAAAVLLALLAFVAAGPYLAMNGIRHVVASGEYGQLWRFVDFQRLRESLRPQIQQRISDGIIQRTGKGLAPELLSGVTDMLSEPAIDAMVSPLGIATLLRGTALAKQVAAPHGADRKVPPPDPLAGAKTRYVSPSLFTATVQNADGKPFVFEFGRQGLGWKLTGVRLPD